MKCTFAQKTFAASSFRCMTLAGTAAPATTPYVVAEAQAASTGAAAGQVFRSGATIGQDYHTGATTGQCHG